MTVSRLFSLIYIHNCFLETLTRKNEMTLEYTGVFKYLWKSTQAEMYLRLQDIFDAHLS